MTHKATSYLKRCRRCDEIYRTEYKAGKICNNCKKRRGIPFYDKYLNSSKRKNYKCVCGDEFTYKLNYENHLKHSKHNISIKDERRLKEDGRTRNVKS